MKSFLLPAENKLYQSRKLHSWIILFLIVLAFSLLIFNKPLYAQDYFQQRVDYTISVRLDDQTHALHCFQSLEYTNNSPNTLNELYFHLWPNAYRDENTPLAKSFLLDGKSSMLRMKKSDSGYIDSLDFHVNGARVQWRQLTDTADICRITLNKELLPGESLILTTPFYVKVPSARLSRLGHLGQAYYITQWYPKPAVYDRNGWNYFSYLELGEYYSEFGTFDVSITLPENYLIASSGELIDADEELKMLNEKAKLTARIDSFSSDMSFPPSSLTMKTLRFRQENIHDFAWFADKRYHVLKGEVRLPQEGRTVTTWAFFTNREAKLWKKVPEHLHDAIVYFSNWIGPYPYKHVSAADVTYANGGGMEYPLVTAIGTYGSEFLLEEVVVHEVAHNWFYGILGNNERKYPWMDEGLTSFYVTRYMDTKYAADSSKHEEILVRIKKFNRLFTLNRINYRETQYLSYLMAARKNTDQPADLSAEKYSQFNYQATLYSKMSMGLDHLMKWMGDSIFDSCIRTYYEKWKFKHPQPNDLAAVFSECTEKNTEWFFNDFIRTNKKIDYSIASIQKSRNDSEYKLSLKNKGSIPAPLSIHTMKNGHIVSEIWMDGFTGRIQTLISCNDCDEFRIDAMGRIPELYRTNNRIRTKGIFKKTEKIRFDFLTDRENPERTQIFYAPIGGWNYYNGFMAGIALHNVFISQKKFEYAFAPMYAFGTNDLAGGGEVRYNHSPLKGAIQKITLRTGFSHYAYGETNYTSPLNDFNYSAKLTYTKSDNRVVFQLKEDEPRKRINRTISIRHVYIMKDLVYDSYLKEAPTRNYNYFQVEFLRQNKNPLKASTLMLQATGNSDFHKLSLETQHFFHYNSPKHGFRVRFFAGYLNRKVVNDPGADYRLRTSGYGGGVRGRGFNYTDDFLFDEVFLGRSENEGLLSRQFSMKDGGMTIPTFGYRLADKWMSGIHLSTTLPGKIPIRLYAGLCALNDGESLYPESKAISYEAGIELHLLKDIFVIYFPLVWSSDIQYIIDREDLGLEQLIRFELHLNKLNPLEMIRKIDF